MEQNEHPNRGIPSVDRILRDVVDHSLPRPMVLQVIRETLEAIRKCPDIAEPKAILAQVNADLESLAASRIQPVINATGVLIHTNLGRVPLASAALQASTELARQYSTLEYDLPNGQRGKRGSYVERCLAELCGAEAAAVVNNCAAALVLVLKALMEGERNEIIISRGELIQIGGGFRIPDILEAAGAQMREVGTTNKTSLEDYRRAISGRTALILRVHRSNFVMSGFVESPSRKALAGLAHEAGVPLFEDLGSGALVDTSRWAGLPGESMPRDALGEGIDIVCFSGDKLMGGPQAGLIVGRESFVTKAKKHPFYRAVRCDKMILAALQTVVEAYLGSADPVDEVPLYQMLNRSLESLKQRAEKIVAAWGERKGQLSIVPHEGKIGGGALPEAQVPSVALNLKVSGVRPDALAAQLRAASPPVIGIVEKDALIFDLRTIFPEQDDTLLNALLSLAK
ncbi:MAG: L-seryl-tRNA(Sec) selenium transferase [Verrucomicrobia bacterium]|nr:L-seryl-tRNA(Sec) selenium transferase [Verrucomicrobiota bacterium]